MAFSEIDGPRTPVDRDLLIDFLVDLRSDLDAWTSGDGANQAVEGSVLFPDDALRALARAAFEDGVETRLDQIISALETDWRPLEPALAVNGLTGPNLVFKITMARGFRNPAPDRSRSSREMFGDLSRYLSVASSILSSLKDVLENKMPWWGKLVVELIKEFVDMAEAQASARSGPAGPRGGGFTF